MQMDENKIPLFSLTLGQCRTVLTLLCFICFFNSLNNGLVHDDVFAIIENQDIRANSSITSLFFNDFWGTQIKSPKSHKSYRPLCVLTFRLNYLAHGLNPFGYHLCNLLLHVAVVNLYFTVLYSNIFYETFPSFIAAMIFATHPVHVEAVTGVVGRADVLSCIFFLLAFQVYTMNVKENLNKVQNHVFNKEFIKFILLGIICLLVKENAFTIFGVAIGYDFLLNFHFIFRFFFEKKTCSQEENKKSILKLLLIFKRIIMISLLGVILFVLRLQMNGMTVPRFLHEDNPASFHDNLLTRVMTYAYLAVFNFKLLLAPLTLCYDWQLDSIPLVENLSDLRNLETICFFVASILLGLFILSKIVKNDSNFTYYEPVIVGLCLLIIPFLPASNLFLRVGFVVAERILYIPSLGFCILVAYGINRMCQTVISKSFKLMLLSMFVGLIVLFSLKTVQYNTVWESRGSLFRSGVITLPHNAKVHYNYANYLRDGHNISEAIYHYKQAVRLYPRHSTSHNNLGVLLQDKQFEDNKLAEHHFLEAIKHTPGHYRAMLNLGSLYRDQHRFVEAEDMLMKCISHAASYYEALLLLADTLHTNKKDTDAFALYKRLLKSYPNTLDLLLSYGSFLLDIGYYYDAMNVYTQQVMKMEPNNYIALHNTAKIYHQLKRYDLVETYYKKAMAVDPEDPQAYRSLISFYYDQELFADAKVICKQMMKKFDVNSEQKKNYALILFRLGENDNAIKLMEQTIAKDKYAFSSHLTLINVLLSSKEYDKAREALSYASSLFPDDLEIRLHQGNLERDTKNYKKALEFYFAIIKEDGETFNAVHSIANVYHLTNEVEKAIKYYELSLELKPNDSLVMKNMEKLKRSRRRTHKV